MRSFFSWRSIVFFFILLSNICLAFSLRLAKCIYIHSMRCIQIVVDDAKSNICTNAAIFFGFASLRTVDGIGAECSCELRGDRGSRRRNEKKNYAWLRLVFASIAAYAAHTHATIESRRCIGAGVLQEVCVISLLKCTQNLNFCSCDSIDWLSLPWNMLLCSFFSLYFCRFGSLYIYIYVFRCCRVRAFIYILNASNSSCDSFAFRCHFSSNDRNEE